MNVNKYALFLFLIVVVLGVVLYNMKMKEGFEKCTKGTCAGGYQFIVPTTSNNQYYFEVNSNPLLIKSLDKGKN